MAANVSHKTNTPGPSHEQLLVRIGTDRDQTAFVEIFEYFAPRVKSYLLKQGADEATAEEIVQATMITVWEKAVTYSPAKAAASTWIFTIARNKRIDVMRREKFVTYDTDSPALLNASYTLAENFADPKTVEHLSKEIDNLPEEQSRLLKMAFYEDKSHQAISDETKIPLGTVKSRIRIALEKLRGKLTSAGKEKGAEKK